VVLKRNLKNTFRDYGRDPRALVGAATDRPRQSLRHEVVADTIADTATTQNHTPNISLAPAYHPSNNMRDSMLVI